MPAAADLSVKAMVAGSGKGAGPAAADARPATASQRKRRSVEGLRAPGSATSVTIPRDPGELLEDPARADAEDARAEDADRPLEGSAGVDVLVGDHVVVEHVEQVPHQLDPMAAAQLEELADAEVHVGDRVEVTAVARLGE